MAIGDPYISRSELKSLLGITNTAEDANIDRAVRGATRAIDRKSGFSTFWKTSAVETRRVEVFRRIVPVRQYGYYKLLLPDGIASVTGFLIGGSTIGTLITPTRPGDPYTEIKLSRCPTGDLDIAAVWGWPELPDDIVMAAQLQSHRYYRRRGSPEGIAGSAEWGLTRIPRLDPDVAAILENGGYVNPAVG